jgi:hypothetical protein
MFPKTRINPYKPTPPGLTKQIGAPPYDPRLMVRLLIYGYTARDMLRDYVDQVAGTSPERAAQKVSVSRGLSSGG